MEINRIIEKLKGKSFKSESIPLSKDIDDFQLPSKLSLEIGCGVGFVCLFFQGCSIFSSMEINPNSGKILYIYRISSNPF